MISNNEFIKLSINKKKEYVDSLIPQIGYNEFINSDIFKILSSNNKFNKYLFYLKKIYSDDLEFLNYVFNNNHKTFDLLSNPNLDLSLTEKLVIKHAKGLDKKTIFNLKEFANVNTNIILNILNVNHWIAIYVIDIFKYSKDFNLIIDFISNEDYKLYMDLDYFNLSSVIKNFEKLSNNKRFNILCYDYICNQYTKNYYKPEENLDINVINICDMFLAYSLNKIDFSDCGFARNNFQKIINFARETRNSIFK